MLLARSKVFTMPCFATSRIPAMFTGSIVALATPFGGDDAVDRAALERLIEFHIDAGTDGLVIAGTTGESATLDKDEHVDLVARAVRIAAGRLPVIAGTGSNSTAQTVALSLACERAGADGFLLVAPYYNKPTQEGLVRHFSSVCDAVSKPVILYNVPGRTCSDILPETLGRLAALERVVGIKDATGDLERLAANRAACPDDFVHLSGDDFTALDFLRQGGDGVISVTANVVPDKMAGLCAALARDDYDAAKRLDESLQPLNAALFVESNPIPVKWALYRMGLIGPGIRLPLTPLADAYRETVEQALDAARSC